MLALLLAVTVAGAAHDDCAFDKTAMLALSPEKFDQDLDGGWRVVARRNGCGLAVADLLAAYRSAHWGTLKENELELNYWHEGQLRAEGGQSADAVRLLMAGVGPDSGADFEDYALGTVAFLQRDKRALKAARTRLADQPMPAEWPKTAAAFKAKGLGEPAWPPNLNVLDGLIACFGKPYAEAYECRPSKPQP